MGKASLKNKITFRNVAILVLIVLLFTTILLVIAKWEGNSQQNTSVTQTDAWSVSIGGQQYQLNPHVKTMLIMGLDKFEDQIDNSSYNNDQQADFLMLLVMDNKAKTYTMLHINRDTMVETDVLGVTGEPIETVTQQIALAHTYGNGKKVSCRNTCKAVSRLLLGMNINYYLSVTMDAVPTYNDLVGGVEVEVLDDFTGIDDTLKKGETVTLRGEQSLRYVRTRYGLEDSSNNTRMLRQQQYVNNLFEKTKQCIEQNQGFILKVAPNMEGYIETDRSADQLQTIFEHLTEYTNKGIVTIDGDSYKGERFMEFYPNRDSQQQVVIDLFCEPKKK